MFYCKGCGRLFTAPRLIRESRGEFWGAPCWENVAVCPRCGDSDIEEEESVDEEAGYHMFEYDPNLDINLENVLNALKRKRRKQWITEKQSKNA